MTTADVTPPVVRSRRIWRWLLAGAGLCFAASALAVYNFVTPTREAMTLREELISALPHSAHTRTQVQVTVGPVLLGTVRAVASLIDDVPAEARLALRAVRKASVGVYELAGGLEADGRARMVSAADDVMQRRGWTRVVGVNDKENLVLVYVPERDPSGSSERVCVAVCNDEYLVVVSGTISLAPLVELAVQQGLMARR
jgi:hypothetical protein